MSTHREKAKSVETAMQIGPLDHDLSKLGGFALDQQADDKTEKSKDRAKNLDDENLDESGLKVRAKSKGRRGEVAYRPGSAASASAALLPLIPTDTPQMRLHMPTVKPAQNRA
jgi:multidrug resistance efflux pump